MKPTLGRIVLYRSKIDNGPGNDVLSPAIVIRTRETTVVEVIARWKKYPDPVTGVDGSIVHPGSRPDALVEVLPDDMTVDLYVIGLGHSYREYCVSQGSGPGQWDWPPRVPTYDPPTTY